MNLNEITFLSILGRTFQKQLCVSFPIFFGFILRSKLKWLHGFHLENGLEMQEFRVNLKNQFSFSRKLTK